MNSSKRSLAATITAIIGLTGLAQAAPPDIVQSDTANNTAMGTGAGSSITSAFNNTAAGSHASSGDSTGINNVSIGFNSMLGNQTGGNNTAVGTAPSNTTSTPTTTPP